MRTIILSLITLAFSVAFAQEQQTVQTAEPAKKLEGEKNMWVEINFPISENGGFGDAIAESKRKSQGAEGFSFGWEPFDQNKPGSKIAVFFRKVGFSANVTINDNQPNKLYDGIVAQTYTLLSPFQITTTCAGDYGGGKKCVDCGWDNNGLRRVCTVETIYGRYVPLKYSQGSIAIGMYVPVSIGKLIVQAGVNARLHLVKEGQFSNDLKKTIESTVAASIRVAYPLPILVPGFKITGGIEQSIVGSKSGPSRFKYRAYTLGGSISW